MTLETTTEPIEWKEIDALTRHATICGFQCVVYAVSETSWLLALRSTRGELRDWHISRYFPSLREAKDEARRIAVHLAGLDRLLHAERMAVDVELLGYKHAEITPKPVDSHELQPRYSVHRVVLTREQPVATVRVAGGREVRVRAWATYPGPTQRERRLRAELELNQESFERQSEELRELRERSQRMETALRRMVAAQRGDGVVEAKRAIEALVRELDTGLTSQTVSMGCPDPACDARWREQLPETVRAGSRLRCPRCRRMLLVTGRDGPLLWLRLEEPQTPKEPPAP